MTFTVEDHPIYERLTPEAEQKLLQQGRSEWLERYNQLRTIFIGAAKHDPLRAGFEPDMWKVADRQVEELKKLFPSGVTQLLNLGGNRACCVKGTLIHDAATMKRVPIEEGPSSVFSFNGARWTKMQCEKPFSRGVLPCVRIALSNGNTFDCATTHRVLRMNRSGPLYTWVRADDVSPGDVLLSYPAEITVSVSYAEKIGDHECWDFHVPAYENYMMAGVCHHNSKTHRAAKRIMQLMIDKPGARVWCLQSTETVSKADQQPLIFSMIPPEWRPISGRLKPKGDRSTKIVFSDADGFTKNSFILPNGSQCWFKFFAANVKTLEGAELDACWCFSLGTLIATPEGEKPIDQLSAGDIVLTSKGPRQVEANSSRIAPVGVVKFSNGQQLVGTADHPVLTETNGWVRLSELKEGDQVCVNSAFNSTAKHTIHTEADTIKLGEENRELPPRGGLSFTAIPTSFGSGRFRRGITSTTLTKTSLTTSSVISPAYLHPSTPDCITVNETCPNHGVNRSVHGRSAVVAEAWYGEPFVGTICICHTAINVGLASQNGIEKPNERARSVGKRFEAEVGISVASVVSTWADAGNQEVFNLRVADCHEYFANGILVHNCDELVPPDWIEALIFRLVNRNGHLLITFTPVEHFSDTVKMYLSGAQTLESEKAELLPIFNAAGEVVNHETVPRIQQSGVASARIIYFHTKDNPFGNYEGMKAELRGSPPERIKLRAYGIPTASQGSQFSFDESVHKIRHADFLDLVRRYPDGSRYHLVDPCSGRNWFMGWAFCPYNVEVINADGSTTTQPKVIWYREWPSPGKYIEGVGEPGPWAVIGGTLVRHDGGRSPADGDRGPAQKPFRFGLKRYIDEYLRCERILNPITTKVEQEHVTERWIDSRYAHAAVTDREEQTTLIEQLQSLGQIFLAMVSEQKILGVNDGSIDMINSALYYDKTIPIGQFSADMGRANEPLMQVTDDCPNMIFSLSNWTGLDGQSGACKDPIDLIRGFYLSRLCHVDASMFATLGGGCY